jgi:excisionase family DNA binding protein
MPPLKQPGLLGPKAKLRPTVTPKAVQALRLIKLPEVARILGLSETTVRRRVHDGSLSHKRIKGRLYFSLQDVQSFLDKHRGPSWSGGLDPAASDGAEAS